MINIFRLLVRLCVVGFLVTLVSAAVWGKSETTLVCLKASLFSGVFFYVLCQCYLERKKPWIGSTKLAVVGAGILILGTAAGDMANISILEKFSAPFGFFMIIAGLYFNWKQATDS